MAAAVEFATGFRLTWFDVVAMLAAYLVCHFLRYARHPGPVVWPVVGMIPSLSRNIKTAYDWVTGVLNSCGGTFTFVVPWVPSLNAVVTADPTNVEYILKSSFSSYPKGPSMRRCFHDLLGDGIFNSDHERWLSQRKLASLQFYARGFKDASARSARRLVEERLVPLLAGAAAREETIDLQDVMLRFTFDQICILALGEDPHCLVQGLPRVAFAREFDVATTLTLLRFTVPEFSWRLQRALCVGREKRLAAAVKVVKDYVAAAVERRKRRRQQPGDVESPDLISCFLRARDFHGDGEYSDDFIRDVAINLILAGRDTSSVALAWFFWLLHHHPRVEAAIVAELDAVAGRDRDRDRDDGSTFTAEELKQMNYLQACLTESLRLYPSVPVDSKEAIEDDVLPDGTRVKKGWRVIYSIYSMGRSRAIWGDDAAEFKPERWIKNGVFVPESPFRFAAFNAGPRLCLGKDVAYLQMKAIAAAVIRRFELRVAAGHVAKQKLSLTLFMRNGLPVSLRPRRRLSSSPPPT